MGTQHVGDAAIEAFDQAIGLGPSGFDQAVFDTVIEADLVEDVVAGWRALAGGAEAVCKFLAVVGQELGDFERGLLDEALEEAAGRGC